MKKLVLIGRSEAGKTTLTQALRGEKIHYHKTQYVNNFDVIVDTPGEYAQTQGLGHALALYTYESDVVGLMVSAIEPYCLFPPCITCMANREVIGIVTKIHNPQANVKLAILLAGAGRLQKDLLCGFQAAGRHPGNPGISPGRGRCNALGRGSWKAKGGPG